MFLRLHDRFAAARAGDAMELEQGQLRLWIQSLVAVGFFVAFMWDRVLDDAELVVISSLIFTLPTAVGLFVWMLLRPGPNHLRRRLGILQDMCTTVFVMAIGEEAGAILFGFFLWVIIGNGFRFGRWYLHYAQFLAVAGFTAVLLLSDFWRQHATLSAALYLTLLLVPVYVAVLVDRLTAANRRLDEARRQAEAANTAKTRFLAAASHDLRQPMQALSMYASVLEERGADPNVARVVHGIQLSVRTLEQLFDSVLDISRIESGVIRPNVVAFPLMPLIDNIVEAELPSATRKGLVLRAVRTSLSVRSDPALLERMLKNLLTNAVRYTESGRIVIGCRRLDGSRVRLEIVDSGIGIATEEYERIFDEYYQIDGASAQGLGLGLPIVKSLGELLGHKVSVRSAPGRGSTFSIELERSGEVAVPALIGAQPPALAGTSVVLVDDDVEIRDSMRLLLESWGCRFIGGASLADVEEKLRSQKVAPDALIVDYRLAGAMTGLQVIEQLRALFGRNLPALVITGTANLPLLQSRAPGLPIAAKPVAPGKLRAFLSSVA
jgi:signal transduction histidine kinase